LYQGKPCSACGQRFPADSKAFQKHLDWHFRTNLADQNTKNSKKLVSREWFPSVKEFSNLNQPRTSFFAQLEKTKEQQDQKTNKRKIVVAQGDLNQKCSICDEWLQVKHDDEEAETWVFVDAIERPCKRWKIDDSPTSAAPSTEVVHAF